MAPGPPGHDSDAAVDNTLQLHLWSAATGEVVVSEIGHVEAMPSWSGDGARLALATDTGAPAGAANLTILDRASLASYTVPGVTVQVPPACDTCRSLAWTQDGSALLVAGADGGPGLFTYHSLAASGSGVKKVAPDVPRDVAWSADGASIYGALDTGIARARARAAPGQVSLLDVIPGSRAGDASPTLPGFDRRLAFVRPVDGRPQLFLMNNDGTGVVQLTFADYDPADQLVPFGVTLPRWAPAG
jgi:Tol biopolymer transport system component